MVRAPLGSQPTNHAASAPPAAATKCSYRCGEITPTIYVLDGKLHSNNFGYSRPVVAQAQTNRFRRCLRLLLAVMALSALVACAGQAELFLRAPRGHRLDRRAASRLLSRRTLGGAGAPSPPQSG